MHFAHGKKRKSLQSLQLLPAICIALSASIQTSKSDSKLLAGTGIVAAGALQRHKLLRILALRRAIFTALLRETIAAILRTFLNWCRCWGRHGLVLHKTPSVVGCRETARGCAPTCCFRADARRVSCWSRSTSPRSASGQSPRFARYSPSAVSLSVCDPFSLSFQ